MRHSRTSCWVARLAWHIAVVVQLAQSGCGGSAVEQGANEQLKRETDFAVENVGPKRVPAWPGDPAPTVIVAEWIRPGQIAGDSPGALFGDGITVAVLFATWCPLSRVMLPELARLQQMLAGEGVRCAALFAEPAEVVREFVAPLAVDGLALGLVAGPEVFGGFLPASGVRPVPFAAVVGPGDDGSSVVYWRGPAIGGANETTPGLTEVLEAVVDGSFDLQAARSAVAEHSRCDAVLDRLGAPFELAWKEREFLQLRRLASELAGAAALPGCALTVVTALNDAAFTMLVDEESVVGQFAIALEIAELAIRVGGGSEPAAVDTYARALFENGRYEEAFTEQLRAVALLRARGLALTDEYLEPLQTYADAACRRGLEEACRAAENAPRVAGAGGRRGGKDTVLFKRQDWLRSARALADLRTLKRFLRERYAGFDDMAFALATSGSSWDAYTVQFERRIDERRRWRFEEFKKLITEYLSVTGDRHVLVADDREAQGAVAPVRAVVAFFVEGRVKLAGDRFVFRAAGSSFDGLTLLGVKPIGSPRTAVLNQPYLFPTLPESATGKQPEAEYLLGMLVRDSDHPGRIDVPVLSNDGSKETVSIPVHRGRTAIGTDIGSRRWWLDDDPRLPVLRIRALWGDVAELPLSAAQLRDRDAVLLDLRGNGGGADSYAIEWCSRFSRQDFALYTGAAAFNIGHEAALERWSCELSINLPRSAPGTAAMPDVPYPGRLVVLVDSGTASAGESFTALATQIERAIVVGENTGGAVTYGNVDQRIELPESGLWVWVGRTKFVPAGRVARESFGTFPDFWLDTDNPEEAIARYLGLTH